MSSSPQWKMFQLPNTHSSSSQDNLDLQQSNMQAKQVSHNGTYSSEYPSSSRDHFNNMGQDKNLPSGSVVLENVGLEIMQGLVLKPLERNIARAPQNDPLPGRIRYWLADYSEVEVPFGDKDQCGEFTLRHGDWVQFQVATDRRDQLKRATNISLLDESFNVSGERREQGVVCSLRKGFGFIRCVEREQNIFFHFAELLRPGQELSVGDEVEFTVEPAAIYSNMNTQKYAVRIKHLPLGTVQYGTLLERNRSVAREAQPAVTSNGTNAPVAISIQMHHVQAMSGANSRLMKQGFVVIIDDGFGFIEAADQSEEAFFQFSNLEGSPAGLELGTEVEYSLGRVNGSGGGCASAEFVRVMPRGTVPVAKPLEPILFGTVTRTLRALNPEQAQYSGVIRVEGGGASYEFGIMGLSCKREILQVGDPVTFQADVEGRATNIVPIRKKRRATVGTISVGSSLRAIHTDVQRSKSCHQCEDMEFRLQYNKEKVDKMLESKEEMRKSMMILEKKTDKLFSTVLAMLIPEALLEHSCILSEMSVIEWRRWEMTSNVQVIDATFKSFSLVRRIFTESRGNLSWSRSLQIDD